MLEDNSAGITQTLSHLRDGVSAIRTVLAAGFTQGDITKRSVLRQYGQLRETLFPQYLRIAIVLHINRFVFRYDTSRGFIPVVFMQMGHDQRINVEQGVDIDRQINGRVADLGASRTGKARISTFAASIGSIRKVLPPKVMCCVALRICVMFMVFAPRVGSVVSS